jgi:hypothetical protein
VPEPLIDPLQFVVVVLALEPFFQCVNHGYLPFSKVNRLPFPPRFSPSSQGYTRPTLPARPPDLRPQEETDAAVASAIVTPAPMKKRRQMTDGQEQPQRSAIVEPKKPRNTTLAHLIDDYDPEAHRRTGEKADELFREIVRRAAKP